MSVPDENQSAVERKIFSTVDRILVKIKVLIGDIGSNLKKLPKQSEYSGNNTGDDDTDADADAVALRHIEVNIQAEQLGAGVERFQDTIGTKHRVDAYYYSMPSLADEEDEAAQAQPLSGLQVRPDALDEQLMKCILFLAIFPPGEVIKKRLLIHWWLGEEMVRSADAGKECFDELFDRGLVQPALRRGHCQRTHYFRVHPVVHSQLVDAARSRGFIEFPGGNGKIVGNRRLFLQEGQSSDPSTRGTITNAFLSVFNLDMVYLKMHIAKSRITRVVQLGRWKSSVTHHIELEGDNNLLKNVMACKNLRYLSLRGISLIESIPEAIGMLTELLVLDLRACHNLENLPGSIGSLQKLEYLDLSECFLLEEMPKEIGELSKLQVLKGFLVGSSRKKSNPCRLFDLATKAHNLRKLSITTGRQSLVCDEDELCQLTKCQCLESLTITWRGEASTKACLSLPSSLTKLDLRRAPTTSLLNIIRPSTSASLKRLYLRGGKIRTFGKDSGWKVETLRARFLNELECEWSELHGLFQELHFVEMWRCARLSFWPCDRRGIWEKGSPSMAGRSIGVCYGVKGNNLPPWHEVVQLYASNNIPAMRMFYPHHDVLEALRGTGITISLDVEGQFLPSFASEPSVAAAWVKTNVQAFYPEVSFKYITVGNQVPMREMSYILPAMQNIYTALSEVGLDHIKVSTSVRRDVLGVSYPPSDGAFTSAMEKYMAPLVQFLAKIGAPLLASVFPYFTYVHNQADIDIDYALFTSPGPVVQDGAYNYQNLFDATVDALYSAMEKVGGSTVRVVVSDSGWPSAGAPAATKDNAKTYIQNLINHVGKGTPKRPVPTETYIFAMFNENEKTGDEIERNFGLFEPDKSPVYPISFSSKKG
uniref:Glucan endo-1,3-beta-D-glucosidase n=1 Tax=Leersia perrieri TaxID=77586 RepID=A0A0D9VA67_9ORYZ